MKFLLGDRVTKTKGSKWTGKIVGFYSTEFTPEGYAVESETETGSVQIYPVAALEAAPLEEHTSIFVLWGEAPDTEDPDINKYSFNTPAEAAAFKQGVFEAQGWNGYQFFDSISECYDRVQELKVEQAD